MASHPAAAPFPLAAADLCVKCGLCLPHCPTYGQTRHEGDSPRGRISLMQGLATGAISKSASLEAHLDGCLGCRACEKVCPAEVPYGALIDAGRAQLADRSPPSRTRFTRLIGRVLTHHRWRNLLRWQLWLYQRSGLQRVIRGFHLLGRGRLARLESFLPDGLQMRAQPGMVMPTAPAVQLFSGCVGDIVDQATLNAARLLCARLGLQVEEPAGQTCCGALYQHAGLPDAAQRLAERNIEAFPGDAPVMYCASGCGATLREYASLSRDPRATAFQNRVEDVHAVLARHWPAGLTPRPLAAHALLHLPCSQRNVVGGVDTIGQLLQRIPQLRISPLDASGTCCGAAGSYFVTQPQMADALLTSKLDRIAALKPDYILSSNIGCALHLVGGLRRHGLKVAVMHPVQLLAQQLAP